MSESPVEGSITNLIRWGTRQLTWVRWYYPMAWAISVSGAVGLTLAKFVGLALIYVGYTLPGLLMLSTLLFEVLTGLVAHVIIRKNMHYSDDKFAHSFSYAAMMPIVFFVLAYNNFTSIFTRKITWGGRIYQKPQ